MIVHKTDKRDVHILFGKQFLAVLKNNNCKADFASPFPSHSSSLVPGDLFSLSSSLTEGIVGREGEGISDCVWTFARDASSNTMTVQR
eukprot:scaffold3290_cov165-Ochromonas_danica.AAC.27